jgi:hypothetical protein
VPILAQSPHGEFDFVKDSHVLVLLLSDFEIVNPISAQRAKPPIENDHVPGCRDKERPGVTRPTAP